MSTPGTSPEDFEKLAYKPIVSPAFGLVFAAPASWRKGDDARYFQVLDPDSGAEFTASAYAANGLFLEQWATLRNSVVAREMPYLKCVRDSYGMKGANVSGIARDYRGVFPDSGLERHYLVLCLRTEQFLISCTLTARVEDFAVREVFYRWLLQNKLDVYDVYDVGGAKADRA